MKGVATNVLATRCCIVVGAAGMMLGYLLARGYPSEPAEAAQLLVRHAQELLRQSPFVVQLE